MTLIVHYVYVVESMRHRTDCEAMNAETELHFMSIFVNIFHFKFMWGTFPDFVKGKLIFFDDDTETFCIFDNLETHLNDKMATIGEVKHLE